MKHFTISRAAAACGARIADGFGDRELGRIVIDSRRVQPGDLFVAYRGEKVDGHDYIPTAFDKGAACCLAERVPEGETRPLILVESVQRALEQIAAAYRETLSIPVIGITGSVGKTSAKEMIAAVLSQRLRVLKTEGNFNNQIGVPMTVSRITRAHEAAVVEMGISGFGEMTELARIARPTAAVYTVIGSAHLEFLHDRDGVLRAKGEMLDEMDADAPVFVNGDDDKLRALKCRQRKILFGLGKDCEVRAEAIRLLSSGHHHGVVQVSGISYKVQTKCERTPEDINQDGVTESWEMSCLCSGPTINGQPIDPQKRYKIVMSDFLFNGGDSIKGILKTSTILEKGPLMKRTIMDYISSKEACFGSADLIDPQAPRITVGTCDTFL
jgi:UDP-N-acetylmuramyl pentapeptide synthase